jgi:Arc/MetJ-type ribon-helix-helix transcriptional regulator
MPRLTRRDKVISIRLSNEEYDQLQTLCEAKGGNSISELARNGMKLLLSQEHQSGQATIESRVNYMQDRVMTLDREVARLTNVLGLAKAKEA